MKRSIYLLILVFLGCSAGGFMTKSASVDFDKFQNKTTYRSGEVSVLKSGLMQKDNLYLRGVAVTEGETSVAPENIMIVARGLTTKLIFNNVNVLFLIIDGETHEFPSSSYSSSVTRHSGTVGFTELNIYHVPFDLFVDLANQDKVEGKLSIHEFEISNERLGVFRDFLTQFE